MRDGIYFLEFQDNFNDFGNGVFVVQNNIINGGNYAFSFQGEIIIQKSKVIIKQHDNSIEKAINETLNVSIKKTNYDYELLGSITNRPNLVVYIKAKFIGDLFLKLT